MLKVQLKWLRGKLCFNNDCLSSPLYWFSVTSGVQWGLQKEWMNPRILCFFVAMEVTASTGFKWWMSDGCQIILQLRTCIVVIYAVTYTEINYEAVFPPTCFFMHSSFQLIFSICSQSDQDWDSDTITSYGEISVFIVWHTVANENLKISAGRRSHHVYTDLSKQCRSSTTITHLHPQNKTNEVLSRGLQLSFQCRIAIKPGGMCIATRTFRKHYLKLSIQTEDARRSFCRGM